MVYSVTCTLCTFELEFDDIEAVRDFRDEHQRKYGDDHVIEFELLH